MTSPKTGQHDFFHFQTIIFKSFSETQKMPLQPGSAQQFGDLQCVESEETLAFSSNGVPLTQSDWNAAHAMLRECEDLSAVIILQEQDWYAQLFSETWNALPSRLASLAIRPPHATSVVARSSDAARSSLQRVSDKRSFALWRCLAELAKSGSKIGLQQGTEDAPLVESATVRRERNESGLPELLSLPPRHELDWLFGELRLVRLSDLCGEVVSSADATAVLAGLWLLHGDADESHRQSQSIEDEGRHRCGNFWHGIMHRQEPDYGNSKYWFRRVGQHPIFPELARRADALILAAGSEAAKRWHTKLGVPGHWDPFAFVDWCESASRESDAAEIKLVRHIQFVEMQLLMRVSYDDATRP